MTYVVRGHSESGDHYLAVFKKKPTSAQLEKIAHQWDGDANKEGPGDYGSYVHLTVTKETPR